MMEEVTLINSRQVTEYMMRGVMPKRVYRSDRNNTICYVFDKKDTEKVWNMWKNKQLRY